jgi:hypothetical protein
MPARLNRRRFGGSPPAPLPAGAAVGYEAKARRAHRRSRNWIQTRPGVIGCSCHSFGMATSTSSELPWRRRSPGT